MDKYISQTSLIDKLNNAITLQKVIARNLDVEDDPNVQMELKAYTDILNGIKDEPAADVRPVVRGKWIKPKGFKTRCQCSECKVHPVRGEPNFCPNCGVYMREDAEHETTDR